MDHEAEETTQIIIRRDWRRIAREGAALPPRRPRTARRPPRRTSCWPALRPKLDALGAAVWSGVRLPPPVIEPPVPEAALLVAIAGRAGKVAPGDVMRLTGGTREAAEALLCRLVARHGGEVEATDDGAVVYRFPRLGARCFAQLRAWAARGIEHGSRSASLPLVPPVWERRQQPPPVVPREERRDLLWAAVALGVWLAALLHLFRAIAFEGGGSTGAQAMLLVSAGAFALPAARLVRRATVRRQAAAENGRRRLLRAVLERPAGAALGAYELSHVWLEGSGHPITPAALSEEIRALGGEPDVTADGRVFFRFADLDHETRALASRRG